ncbi:MAG: hypothetical protein H6993_18435 [Pseudomonadales bacterium]|nr:hypothetical protein [Pseudomonadales bacterium]MCP5185950.1 hypothetical protein [Pseudomonadales bacterium]
MDVLLRELVTGPDGGETFQDRELSGDPITLGSGQDQTLQLIGTGIRGRHAQIRMAGGKLAVSCARGARLQQDGRDVRGVSLAEGEEFSVGGHRLKRIPAPAGFAAALELIRDRDVDSASFENAYLTRLSDTWLSKRAPAWAMLVLIVALGLCLPLWFVLDGDDTTPDPQAALFTDAIWTSGPLHPVHNQAMGNDCQACHKALFERVPDTACQECHTTIADHVAGEHMTAQSRQPDRCATCHKEHNEPTLLVISADSLCTDCHADPDALAGANPHLRAVSAFDGTRHPGFEVALQRSERLARDEYAWHLVETALDGARETSNLKFPHDVHLAGTKVKKANGEKLGCVDCHQLAADKEHFVPVTMAANCRECHELTFDAANPERQLPHGQPHEAVAIMEAHFIRYYANPSRGIVPKKRERRRRANQAYQPTPAGVCTSGATQCAVERTRAEAENQFTSSGCVTCHEVTDNGGGDVYTRFEVLPVKLSHDFMPTARFDHQSHLTQRDKSGDDACLTCHDATDSETSADVLLPGLDNCTACHSDADADAPESVPLDCIGCHAFHPPGERLEFTERFR